MPYHEPWYRQFKIVTGLAPVTPASSTPDRVCLRDFDGCAVVILARNGTSVVGSNITLHQATDAAGSNEKQLRFTRYYAATNTGTGDVLLLNYAPSYVFTTDATNSTSSLYVIEIHADSLDATNGFDWIRAGTTNAANTVLSVVYFLHSPRTCPLPTRSVIL